jgi:hypothetical protein
MKRTIMDRISSGGQVEGVVYEDSRLGRMRSGNTLRGHAAGLNEEQFKGSPQKRAPIDLTPHPKANQLTIDF